MGNMSLEYHIIEKNQILGLELQFLYFFKVTVIYIQ